VSEVGSSLLVMRRARDRFLAADTGATGAGGSARARELAVQIRAESATIAAAEARRLRLLGQFSEVVSGDAAAMLSMEGRGPTAPEELVRSAVIGEIQAVLGVPAFPAERSMDLARRLHTVLPETLDALQAGRLDLVRARELSEATEVLSDDAARRAQDQLLGAAGDAPWAGLSPRAWKARIAGRWSARMSRGPGNGASRSTRSGWCARGPPGSGWGSCWWWPTPPMWRWPNRSSPTSRRPA